MCPRHAESPLDPRSSQIRAMKDSSVCFPSISRVLPKSAKLRLYNFLTSPGDSLVTEGGSLGSHARAPREELAGLLPDTKNVQGRKENLKSNYAFRLRTYARKYSVRIGQTIRGGFRPFCCLSYYLFLCQGSAGTGKAFWAWARLPTPAPKRARSGGTELLHARRDRDGPDVP